MTKLLSTIYYTFIGLPFVSAGFSIIGWMESLFHPYKQVLPHIPEYKIEELIECYANDRDAPITEYDAEFLKDLYE